MYFAFRIRPKDRPQVYQIDPNIRSASTLPADFYRSQESWKEVMKRVFERNWIFLGDEQQMFRGMNTTFPMTLLENYLQEPILLTQSDDEIRCLTNVCTHRGFKIVDAPSIDKNLRCQYHGRKFGLDGSFLTMPEFDEAEDFPRACDNLHRLPLVNWRRFLFTAIEDPNDQSVYDYLNERMYFLPIEDFQYAPELSKTYNVHANWALYIDNYLEGFHIPFVHMDLGKVIDYGSYATECSGNAVLQIGYSRNSDFTFDLPKGHPDADREVTAYYYWLYPNFMLNFYPWGVQTNHVRPITPDFCKVDFEYYIHDEKIFRLMQGDKLAEKTEREDEFVVEAVQEGIKSRFYPGGRFSPTREQGVHHFHKLLAEAMNR